MLRASRSWTTKWTKKASKSWCSIHILTRRFANFWSRSERALNTTTTAWWTQRWDFYQLIWVSCLATFTKGASERTCKTRSSLTKSRKLATWLPNSCMSRQIKTCKTSSTCFTCMMTQASTLNWGKSIALGRWSANLEKTSIQTKRNSLKTWARSQTSSLISSKRRLKTTHSCHNWSRVTYSIRMYQKLLMSVKCGWKLTLTRLRSQ